MKKFLIILLLGIFVFSQNSYSQIKVNSSGKVGINLSNPQYNLDIFGNGRFRADGGWGELIFDDSGYSGVVTIHPLSDWVGCLGTSSKNFNLLYVDHVIARIVTETSDENLKENIVDLEGSLAKLKMLRGVKFDFKEDYFETKNSELKNELIKKGKNNIGFLAQELKEVFPEVVFHDESNDLYSVNYTMLIPVLVEALKEQQKIINNLSAQVESIENDCCNNNENLKSRSIENDNGLNADENPAKLFQNTPNPFNNQTTIRFNIPQTVQSAQLHICNMTGTLLKTITINQRGTGQEIISANEFNAGMYLYSLVNDGRIIDTKQMLLTN